MTPPGLSLPSWEAPGRPGDLIENLGMFCRLLREHGVTIPLGKEIDAASGLLNIDLFDPVEFQLALKTTLLGRKNDHQVFDDLFRSFWIAGARNNFCQVVMSRQDQPAAHALHIRKAQALVGDDGKESEGEERAGDDQSQLIPCYSPEELLRKKTFEDFTEADLEEMDRLLAKMAVKLATRRSRQMKPSIRRHHVHFRRSFRAILRYGGEFVELAYRERKLQHPTIVLLCDTSGSMDAYSRFLLRFLFSLKRASDRVETFVFSTSLTRLTPFLSGKEINATLDLVSEVARDWSGGTDIGGSLEEFLVKYGSQMLGTQSVVVILSDGFDQGETDRLEYAMTGIRKRARKLIWLNPLLASHGYEPTCRGMKAALPFVDHFAAAHNLESLERVVDHLRI